MEDRLPSAPAGKFYKAASVVDFNISQQKAIVSAAPNLRELIYIFAPREDTPFRVSRNHLARP